MVKKKLQSKKARVRPRAKIVRTRARSSMAAGQLDLAALKHRALLLDPCNAEMTNGVYAGLGTGQFRRFRAVLASDGNSVEGTYVFQLSTGLVYNGTHVAATAGTNYTYGTATALFPAYANSAVQGRCLAGCVKVRYVGAESARSGTIGMAVVPGQYGAPGSVSTAVADLARCPFVTRFGEVIHEVKWAPSQADEEFTTAVTLEPKSSCIVINYRGIPATSLQFEVTACYELEFFDSNVPLTSVGPTSRNTLNHVLQSLGPVSSWAYSTVVAPTIKAGVQRLMATPITGKFASAVAAGLMTL
jgi:hypothetical protein